jgi:hypothetical protein
VLEEAGRGAPDAARRRLAMLASIPVPDENPDVDALHVSALPRSQESSLKHREARSPLDRRTPRREIVQPANNGLRNPSMCDDLDLPSFEILPSQPSQRNPSQVVVVFRRTTLLH